MDKRYYTVDDLEAELRGFETRYGIATLDFFRLYERDEAPSAVSEFDGFVWADLHREVCRLRGCSSTDQTVLQPAG